MRLDVNIDAKYLQARMLKEQKRLAYNTVQALNNTAKVIQAEERKILALRVKVRKKDFIDRLIKIAFASVGQGRPYAEVYIDNTKARLILSTLEDGGIKTPAKGKNVAVPITGSPARPSFDQSVPAALTFGSLGLKPELTSQGKTARGAARAAGSRFSIKANPKTGNVIFQGRMGTYLIPGEGLFQHQSGGKSILLYRFEKNVKLKKRLSFVVTAQRVFAEQFRKELAIAYARTPVE